MIGYEIKYTIDNFSGIIPINRETLNDINKEIKGVYILYNKNKKPIYVGQSRRCIIGRISTHMRGDTKNPNIKSKLFAKYKSEKYEYFSYIKVDNELISLVEIGLITELKTKFNKKHNINFEESEEWNNYLKNNKEYKEYLKNRGW